MLTLEGNSLKAVQPLTGKIESVFQKGSLNNGIFQNAIFNSKFVFWIVTDVKGITQVFNKGAETLLGYTAAEVVNISSIETFFDAQHLRHRTTALRLETGEQVAEGFDSLCFNATRQKEEAFDLVLARKDGSCYPGRGVVEALRDAEKNIIGYIFAGRDNSHAAEIQKSHTAALEESELQAQRILNTASDAFIAMDSTGAISEWNQKAERLLGWTRQEVIGRDLAETIISPPFREGHNRGLQHFLKTGEGPVLNRTVEVLALHRDGHDMPIELSVWMVNTKKGIGFNSFIHDLTERKEIERHKLSELTLLARNIELEHSSQMKSDFLATMSHELRTPLTAIIGFAEILKDGLAGPLSESQKEYSSDIFSSGQHLLSLINDILDLSKVEAGMMEINLKPVDINLLLNSCLKIIKQQAGAKRIELMASIPEDLGLLQLDTQRIKQIVYNLLANAIKFTGNGGCVTLHAQRTLRCDVGLLPGNWPIQSFPLIDSNQETFLEIRVTDTGMGISAKNLIKLFKPFSQVDTSLARKFEGTGLGLAMVKKLADLHEGCVAVSSLVRTGSCFAVWIPLIRD